MQSSQEGEYPIPPEETKKKIQQLSSDAHYVLIYPSNKQLKGKYQDIFKQKHLSPYMLVFEDEDNITCIDLIRQYIKENSLSFKEQHVYFYEYRSDYQLQKDMTLAYLKWQMGDSLIDGYHFYVTISEMYYYNPEAKLSQIGDFENQLKKESRIAFYVKDNNSYFYVKQNKKLTFNAFLKEVSNQLKRSYNVLIKPESLKLTFMLNKQEKELDSKNFKKLTNKDYVYVAFLDKVNLPKQNFEHETQYLMIKDTNGAQYKFPYKQIRKRSVNIILDKYLKYTERKLKSSQFGLRIHDLVLKPSEMLYDFPQLEQVLFGQSKYVKIILALVVKQSFTFYSHLSSQVDQLSTAQNRLMFNNILVKSTNNQSHRKNCHEAIKDRAKTAKIVPLKKQQNIEPILYYTSDLLVKEGNSTQKLYAAFNAFLRKMQFGDVDRDQYDSWQLLFAKSLLKSLKLITAYKGDLYRGISHKETYKVGSIKQYKQFNSCTPNLSVALGFASTALLVFKNCSLGRDIFAYSLFQVEEEVINMPYSEYRVAEVKNVKHYGNQIQQVILQQFQIPKLQIDLNDQPLLYVLWVDGPEGEGVQFTRNVQQIRQSTSFIHLTSTKELQNWLKANKENLKDKTISTVLITNMTRTEENGVENGLAGVQAIKTYKAYQPQGKVMLYIGNLEAAKQKLTNNQIPLNSVNIGNTDYSLLQFFLNFCGIS